jgi:hypothetical protein
LIEVTSERRGFDATKAPGPRRSLFRRVFDMLPCSISPVRKGLPLAVASAVLVLAGCGKSEFHKVYPVTGKILVDGLPAAECIIYLNRTFDDDHPRRVSPYAVTEANGEFQITSYITNDGAPEGEYVVTIEWRERSGLLKNNFEGIDRLDGVYAKVGTNKALPGFVIKVPREPLELPVFNLTQSAEAKRKHEAWKKRKPSPLSGGD